MALASDTYKIPSIFQDPPWLGFKHDGYPVVPLNQYRAVRGVEFPHAFNREHFAIFQSVLSFGLLEAVIDCPVPEDALLRIREDGCQVLCLDLLPELLASWTSKARVEGESLTSERERVKTSLSAANKVLSGLRNLHDFPARYDKAEADNLPAMFCALGCIGATLTHAGYCLYPGEDSYPEYGFTWNSVVHLASQEDRVLGDLCAVGWCPSTVNYVLSFAGLASARFFFRRPPAETPGDVNHNQCTIAGCELSKVDVDNYVAQHMVEGCKCCYTKPPLDLVVQLLNSGTNPVMMLPKDKRSGSRLEVADGSRTPYIAISHVWADGLGGSTETGLPTCQFWRFSFFAALFHIRAFWMDAFCVPEDPSVRQKALKLMGRAYHEAELVIVLDKTLQSVSLNSPIEDILSSILTSPWMRRMWTLQEAALAKSVHFQLSDGMFPLSKIDSLYDKLEADVAFCGIARELYTLTRLRRWQNLTISDVVRSLKWRSTSRPSDEIPAIVSLLNVDVNTILSAPLERRMASMLLNLRTVPRDIPFLNVPKLDHPCFRWAPATFMSVALGNVYFGDSSKLSDGSDTALVTPKGLVAKYLVCQIEPQDFNKGERWSLVDNSSMKNYLILDPLQNVGNYRCNFLLFLHSLPSKRTTSCVAALGEEGTIPNSDEPGVCCTYMRRLQIVDGRIYPVNPVDNPVVLKHILSLRNVMIS